VEESSQRTVEFGGAVHAQRTQTNKVAVIQSRLVLACIVVILAIQQVARCQGQLLLFGER
jgi:hypothetical protein